jgi:hypothetical protein
MDEPGYIERTLAGMGKAIPELDPYVGQEVTLTRPDGSEVMTGTLYKEDTGYSVAGSGRVIISPDVPGFLQTPDGEEIDLGKIQI